MSVIIQHLLKAKFTISAGSMLKIDDQTTASNIGITRRVDSAEFFKRIGFANPECFGQDFEWATTMDQTH